jgi:hypothetical protein
MISRSISMFSLQGLNAVHHVVKDRLDKRMANWKKFCLRHCFDVPEGFVAAEDVRTLS